MNCCQVSDTFNMKLPPYSTAKMFLGLALLNGEGVAVDKAEAAAWFRQAAEAGHAGSQFVLGMMCLK